MQQVTSLIQPLGAGTTQAGQDAVLEFDENVHGDSSGFSPDETVFMLFQSRVGVFRYGYANDGQILVSKGKVVRERIEAGLELNSGTRSIALNYIPYTQGYPAPKVIWFGTELNLDASRLLSGEISPIVYDGEVPVVFNVVYYTQFEQLKHSPIHPVLVPEDQGGQPAEEYQEGNLSTWPLRYQVFYG